MQWELEKIYKEQVKGNIPPRKHLQVLGEDDQQQLFRQLTGGKRKGEEVTISQKDQETGKYDVEGKQKITFTDSDIESFNMLSDADKQKIKKMLDTKNFAKLSSSSLHGSNEKYKNLAYNILIKSGDLTGDQLENILRDIQSGKAIDVEKLITTGNYKIQDIFTSDEALTVFNLLRNVGSGELQKGPGEVALDLMSPDINLSTKGDIDINGELYELKLNGGRISDKAGPDPKKMKELIESYIGPFDLGQQVLNIENFIKLLNQKIEDNPDINLRELSYRVFSSILDEKHAIPIAKLFDKTPLDFNEINNEVIKQSFNWYKDSKAGTDGEWDKLIGINTATAVPGVAVVSTGDEFVQVPQKKININIIRSGSGTRENYIDFYPKIG
tara:strand:- start:381 stop:1535 length:1155 start_codon:yes stop_codon:yes gene_type:complete